MSNLKYWLWLSDRKGLTGQFAIQVLEHFGSPESVYFADRGEYELLSGMTAEIVRSLEDKTLDREDQILGDCDRLGIRLLTLQDASYPERLKAIHQPPMVLYLKGRQVTFDEEAAIAIVGTRLATPYGVQTAAQLSADLTRSGARVVTGLAQGIDAAALRGALKVGGPVVSVLGGGVDVVYPRENRELYEDVATVGTLISEYPPGTEPKGSHFPIRNRIISGLTMGVIAVESGASGGTLHTVNHALEQNREVFAVPGPVNAPGSVGTNLLIQEGAAKLVMSAEDVLCEFVDFFPGRLGYKGPLPPKIKEERLRGAAVVPPSRERHRAKRDKGLAEKSRSRIETLLWATVKGKLTDDQREILLALDGQTMKADDVVELTQIPARRVLSALTLLQIQGYVAEESGRRFRGAVKLKME